MKSVVPTSSAKKLSKKKLIENTDPVQQKVVRAAGLEEIDDLFLNLKKSKKLKLELPEIVNNSSISDSSALVGTSYHVALVTENTKRNRPHQEMSELPHGMVKSNNFKVIISPEAPVERIDPESGYKVYKAHILKVGEGGGTELCPFDCDCCF